MAPFQTEAFLLQGWGTAELERNLVAWEALSLCDNYELDSPVNLALRVAASAAHEELWKRTAHPANSC